jgi:hypothetical protein
VVFGLLLVVGTLIQACSDNNGTTGPTFECAQQKGGVKVIAECSGGGSPAPSTGFANTAADIRVQLGVNPNTITPGRRAGVTAFVTNLNGQPLAGRKVQFSTEVGTLDQTVVTTNSAGQASTSLSITPADAANAGSKTSSVVTAFVDGAVGTATVNFGLGGELVLIPAASTQTVGATVASGAGGGGGIGSTPPNDTCPVVGGFTVTFTVSGGVPPYTFSTSGAYPGASVSGNGVYTAPPRGPVGVGFRAVDTVTVVDSLGATATSTVTVECVASGSGG